MLKMFDISVYDMWKFYKLKGFVYFVLRFIIKSICSNNHVYYFKFNWTGSQKIKNMGNSKIKQLNIGDMIADVPIIQGGMAVGISMSGLASAVSNQGGIGVIASAGAGMFEADFFTENIKANIRG